MSTRGIFVMFDRVPNFLASEQMAFGDWAQWDFATILDVV
jgi:hypothetical protein